MRIETTEYGRRIAVDISAEGVSISIESAPMDVADYIENMTTERIRPTSCPSCGEHHDPKEHAPDNPFRTTDLRPRGGAS